VIAFGLISDPNDIPSLTAFAKAYASQTGQVCLRDKVTLLHCTTEYPAPLSEINLRAMETIRVAFGLRAGYSDHSEGITVPIAAAALGACLIEKHFTLDKTMEGPDHKASVEPEELSLMIQSIRDVSAALGSGVKSAQPSEINNKMVARKSLIAARPITEGQIISEADICIKRPGSGIDPSRYWQIIGMRAVKSYTEGQLIDG
jgi:N-acetylneuraminate synthase